MMKCIVVAVLVIALFAAPVNMSVASASGTFDRVMDMIQDQLKDQLQDQLKDGSCEDDCTPVLDGTGLQKGKNR